LRHTPIAQAEIFAISTYHRTRFKFIVSTILFTSMAVICYWSCYWCLLFEICRADLRIPDKIAILC